MIEPQRYKSLTPAQRRELRLRYIEEQDGRCTYCNASLDGPPADFTVGLEVTPRRFPPGFFDYPIHLHHDHKTGMTKGAVHARCNAILFEHHGE